MGKILTDKQKVFVQHFSQTGNATQAAKDAGYSHKTAEQQGYELKNKLSLEIENVTDNGGVFTLLYDRVCSSLSKINPPFISIGAEISFLFNRSKTSLNSLGIWVFLIGPILPFVALVRSY